MAIIKHASINDLTSILEISIQTFSETFAKDNSSEDLKAYLETNFNEEKITAEINNPDSSFYIVWEAATPIGYLKLNTGDAQTEPLGDKAIEIERIYVMTAWHGKKIGQQLYEKALEIAASQQKEYIWLGVWEHNTKAIGFYSKNGFIPFDKHVFMLGTDAQTDLLMKKIL
jgi:diamine N-acetyltransferase